MTNHIATRDEMKAVDRWENEGGRVPPLNSLWASLKSFTTEETSSKRPVDRYPKKHQAAAKSLFRNQFKKVV
jgi:hypothetical protein